MRDAIDGMNSSNFDGHNITINETQSRRGGGSGGGGFRSESGGSYSDGGFSRDGGGSEYGDGAVMKVDTTETVVAAVATKKKCEKKKMKVFM
ncbi:glycine-rich RNA-binding protein 7-like [Arachis ipaensis]|uniref:Uncharacterized protein n=1 Tax=Arachis hypogaea TaxID=3818 RepID=A0A444Z8G6_ARAHY|nr:glycine-rich RNA-binding protein 7-like [Arachis ipaensis]RYR10466.1 hypothetical protein Ahy_B05g078905 [Arachis hypogaea]